MKCCFLFVLIEVELLSEIKQKQKNTHSFDSLLEHVAVEPEEGILTECQVDGGHKVEDEKPRAAENKHD